MNLTTVILGAALAALFALLFLRRDNARRIGGGGPRPTPKPQPKLGGPARNAPKTGNRIDHLTEEALAEVAALIETGRKIEAIKLVREATGMGLKEAKEAVDDLEKQL
jgi:hypothetical protein